MDLRWYISILGHLEISKIPYGIFLCSCIFQNIFFIHCIPNFFCNFKLTINIKKFIRKGTQNSMPNLFISSFLGRQQMRTNFWFWVSQMCPKFTTSIAKKTLSWHLLKNISLKGSILEVSGQVWTREAFIWIYFKIVVLRVLKKMTSPKIHKQRT